MLTILAEADSYGYAILGRVKELSRGELEWSDGMLYPLLHRLEDLALVTAEWGRSPEGRRRKYYRITESGRRALGEQRAQWAAVTETLDRVWRQSPVRPATGAAL